MGLLDVFKRKHSLTGNMTVGLTSIGKQKAENFEAEGPRFEVLAMLAEQGPSTVSEISGETKLNPSKVQVIIRTLMRSGYVKTMSGEGE